MWGSNVRASDDARAISRRTLARGAAWSAPVLALSVAAPAFAASGPCTSVKTNFNNLPTGDTPPLLTFAGSAITATVAYVANHGSDHTPGRTGEIQATTTSPPWNYLEVEMLGPIKGRTIQVTITFSAPVTNLAFRIHDIDYQPGDWDDWVIINTPGYTYNFGPNTTLRGTGTATDEFENTHAGDQDIESGKNHVDLKWAAPLTQVQFTYKAGITGDSRNQHIGIGDLSFTDCV